jgi:hypothetical protein
MSEGDGVDPLRDDYLNTPAPQRLSPQHPMRTEILAGHTAAVQAGRPTYRDPVSGLSVLTAAFLASRGYCCASGCRHCPFIGANPEQKNV